MSQVSITVYKDRVGLYPAGCQRVVSADCALMGVDANVYTEIYPVNHCIGDLIAPVSLMKIKDSAGNFYWTDETTATWAAKVNGVNCCIGGSTGGSQAPITLQGDLDTPAGDVITSPQLYNLVGRIATVTLGGLAIYNVPYTNGSGTGTLNLTAFGGLGSGQIIQITLNS